jgi:hypothetical protein
MAAAALALTVGGCSEEPAPVVQAQPAAPPAPPPAPPKPAVTPVAQLMVDLSIDERVVMDEDTAPATTEDRIAVLEFFDSFVRGDTESIGTMLSDLDRMELEELSRRPEWKSSIDGIIEVVIETGPGPYGEKCALALFDVDDVYQPQLWYFTEGTDAYQFEAQASPPNVMDQLHGDDWISRWHELLEEEMKLASALDSELELTKVDLDEGGAEYEEDEPRGGGSPNRPGFGGGGAGKDRRPPPPKRKPPGAR